jgi:eukaryotic-like serine/threonine-protein kinase
MVIDFGIAKAADESLMTRTGFIVGLPGFMSPEHPAAAGD